MNTIIIAVASLTPMTPLDIADDLRQMVEARLSALPRVAVNPVNVHSSTETGLNCFALARREEDRAGLTLQVRRAPDLAEAVLFWEGLPAAKYTQPYLPFSGLPLGDSTRRNSTEGGVSLQSTTGRWYCEFKIAYGSSGAPGNVVWIDHNRETDIVLVEGMTRNFLASAAGLEAGQTSGVGIAGSTIGCVNGPNGEQLVDLVGYCDALDLQLSTNSQLGTASFTSGGEIVVIPLAAKKIKDGSRWIGTQDISVIVDNRWYVSYAALEEARR